MQNPFQTFQSAMKNPMSAIQQNMLRKMQAQNPQRFKEVMNVLGGKSEDEQKEMAENLAKERGIDLKQFASQFGMG